MHTKVWVRSTVGTTHCCRVHFPPLSHEIELGERHRRTHMKAFSNQIDTHLRTTLVNLRPLIHVNCVCRAEPLQDEFLRSYIYAVWPTLRIVPIELRYNVTTRTSFVAC